MEEKNTAEEQNALSDNDHELTQVSALSEYARLNLQRAETERERMQIIIRSGKATANRFVDRGSHRPFFLPVIGKYIFSHKENRRSSRREAQEMANCIRQLIAIKLDLLNENNYPQIQTTKKRIEKMKAFKILDLDFDRRAIGFVVAENMLEAFETWEKHCLEMDQKEEFESKELEEISREDFNNTSWVDESAEPDENGEYPTVQSNYDEEVANVTEPYVIEFER